MSADNGIGGVISSVHNAFPKTTWEIDSLISLIPRVLQVPLTPIALLTRWAELLRDKVLALMEEKAGAIPEEKRVAIEPHIGVPALQALA
ncbi:MAG: DUF4393 domain-containing protein [Christensenellaceae bacterium]|nr:DUF4393 domain-containing protein [Christensenellaceae bacterium]